MHKLKNKGLLRFMKRGGKICTSPPGGTSSCLSNCRYNKNINLVNPSRNLSTTNVVCDIEPNTNKESSSEWYCTEDSCINLPKEADVVIIGGGSLGCQTIYHLAKLGVTNTVLLEKDKLTAGTTWHTAGLVWRLRPNDTDIQLLNHMNHLVNNIEEETGINPGWINNGGLFIANNKERLNEYKRLHTTGKALGIESYVLSPEESKKLYPLMNIDDVYGTLYSPTDGTIDPTGICTATTRAAKKAGAKVIEGCTVTDIGTEEYTFGTKQVKSVTTSHGTIKTNHVINCTGAWANRITNLVGIDIPLIGYKHAYVTTDRIPGIENMPNIRDHDASVYLKLQGDCLHVGGYEVDPVLIEGGVAKDFAFSLYELDWDVFGIHIEGAVNRVPCLESTGIKSTVCGPESFTPDHKPILGEDPRVRGFFHGCGFNSGGMMFGGGCGNELAKWVVNGRPDLDMSGYDIRRFCPEVSKDKDWVIARSHEAYAKNYSIIFPHDEPLAGRNMKWDPLYEELLKFGCVYQERHGWERPGWFSYEPNVEAKQYDWYGAYDTAINNEDSYKKLLNLDYTFDYPPMHENIKAECMAARYDAALFNMSYFGKFFLSGKDAKTAAEWIFSNRMDGPIGKTIYTCMLNKKAGIEADLTVSIIEGKDGQPEYYIAAAGGAAYHNFAHIQQSIQDLSKNQPKEFNLNDVRLKDCSRDYGMLSLQGPKSKEILQMVSTANFDNESFPVSTNQWIDVAGHKVLALRVSFVGEMGWELHVPNESCIPVYRALMEAGKDKGLLNAGYRAIDSLSIEKGYPHWHAEIKMDDTPLEAGLMFTCKLKTKTDFQGREALEEQKNLGGPTKKKVCFTLDNDKNVCLLGMEAIYKDNKVVGYVRRADYAFYLDKPIAYGYVNHPEGEKVTNDWLSSGDYEIEALGIRYPAKLHLKSPFDSKNMRIQGEYDPEEIRPPTKTSDISFGKASVASANMAASPFPPSSFIRT